MPFQKVEIGYLMIIYCFTERISPVESCTDWALIVACFVTKLYENC